jgi:TIR domain
MTFAFTTFLSHRYKSPEVNLFFFRLFADIAEVQFDVDEGTFATNVTRLERMIRSADAFIGIYPFPGTSEAAQQPKELKKASRYFRLELDLAIRSHKPAIIFYDERYGRMLRCPDNIFSVPFNFREVTGAGQVPSAKKFKEEFRRFREIVNTSMTYSVKQRNNPKSTIGIALPPQSSGGGYTPEDIQTIEETLEKYGFDDRKIIRWPPILNRATFSLFHDADWMIVDLGEEMATTGIPAYLHGQFVPMMRLHHLSSNQDEVSPSMLEKVFFGDLEVGYNKDILVWSNRNTLETGLQERLLTIKADVKRIGTRFEAETYFRSAALRREAIFLSYSGKDRDLAADVSAELKKYFQTVFDYRDGKSIRPGQPWIDEIFKQLSASAIGIPLLSEDYFASGNCMHEAREMIAHNDSGKMKVIPIKLYKEPLSSQPWLQSLQYLRFSDYAKAEDVVRDVVKLVAT